MSSMKLSTKIQTQAGHQMRLMLAPAGDYEDQIAIVEREASRSAEAELKRVLKEVSECCDCRVGFPDGRHGSATEYLRELDPELAER